jgi:alpha-1,3-mannosyltransferase
MVPTVNLAYSDDAGQKIKALKGYVSDMVNKDGKDDNPSMKIEWETTPLSAVKCMPSYENQSWPPWNEAL